MMDSSKCYRKTDRRTSEGGWVALGLVVIVNRMVREGLIAKVTFKQRAE